MARKRHPDEDALRLLREIEVHLAAGNDVAEACRKARISDAMYCTWRKKFGGMGRTCRFLGQPRATQRRQPKRASDEEALTVDIVALAKRYGRYGYRRITALLRTEVGA